jgi:hypothetical protein
VLYAAPSTTVEAVADGFTTGLAGVIGYRLRDNQGADLIARTTTGITEDIAGSGIYRTQFTAPATAMQATVVWDNGAGVYATEDLVVSTVPLVTVVTTPPAAATPPTTAGLTRGQLRAELQATGFNNTTADVIRQNMWLNAAYLWVWNAQDPAGVKINWTFEKIDQAPLAVTAGQAAPAMPADFGQADWLLDDQGNEIAELDPEIFDRRYSGATSGGRSEAYKVRGEQIVLGPPPGNTANYLLSYSRRVCHYTAAGTIAAGPFTDDGDLPLWSDHHMILVFHAALVGHSMNSNPFGATFQGLRDQALTAMQNDLETDFAPSQVWGSGGWSSVYGYGG